MTINRANSPDPNRGAIRWWPLLPVAAIVAAWLWWLKYFSPWVAHNDFAIFQIALERQIDGDVPIVGVYSRLGVSHPGPLREWLFGVPYLFGGRSAAALPATAMAFNVGWCVVVGWLGCRAYRARRFAAAVMIAVGAAVLVVALRAALASPWNPHLAILPLYVACWALIDYMSLPPSAPTVPVATAVWATIGASWAAQMHASALPVGALVLGVATLIPIGRSSGCHRLIPLGVGVALWLGPLIDLAKLGDANLVAIVTADGDAIGLGAALGHWSRLAIPTTWWNRLAVTPSIDLMPGFSRLVILSVVAILLGATVLKLVAIRPADRAGSSAAGPSVAEPVIAMATAAMAVAAMAAFVKPNFRYLYGPNQAVVVFVVMAAATVLMRDGFSWLPVRFRGRPGLSRVLAGVAGVVLAVVVAVIFARVPVDDHESAARRELGVATAVERVLDEHPEWVAVEVVGADLVTSIVDADIAAVAVREGLKVHSVTPSLALPAPDGDEPLLIAAMGSTRDCLISIDDAGTDIVLEGLIPGGGEIVVVTAVRGTRPAACVGR